ncbi:carbohydrate ABC transporter permease [Paenibacillus whitsoniae]|uniref:Carbohydrate ABC transporter permease n=1 Tax=Paenibacillus whitsoniae TaxID=2496558 RepID=A0A430JBH4_9BACL|nr:carbohydrate ABC transporter permease [Paenibacillus whitsoniae]RTE08368.1 carbohydrate ABC transporter permease [Paenibacillus whitsoniae]
MKPTWGERIFLKINHIVLFLAGLSCLLPIVHIASLSMSSGHAILSGDVGLWPVEPTWIAYKNLVNGTPIVNSLKNSIIITVVGTSLNMLFTIFAAYPLSRKHFYAKKFFTLAIVFTMLFSAGLIPNFLLVKSLGLVGNYGAIWIPGLISVYNLLVLRSFFENIPDELEEAARMDGCSEWRLIIQIVLPLSKPVLATLALFYGVNHWNSFFNLLIYINDSNKFNLSVLVQNMVRSQSIIAELAQLNPEDLAKITPESVISAGIMVMILPIIAVYPFLQKYFVNGVMIGAIKG